ncbi:hypothetical protein EYZ11_007312 [Aspergillus tanneri]|uniref:Insecticide toxin TcdB middle/N-terminal domain-containing protein n=1 Tax=Aspergillus tanneri TaxID=1220188 RepID=A0A4S3JFJ9_9EURO|nr:uncharacterized protein ATNIH1004_011631 [Aspergillus tanneri]KAA8641495.1 hypothetical protein ATNIH1004_011631 [Aspergillus tanneri]THC93207.1 hypothetical protein EYZ11_007312 [Aspergillus tanneri]
MGSTPRSRFGVEQPPTNNDNRAGGGDESRGAPGRLLADGDAQRPMQEKFNVNAQTGGGSFAIPIKTTPGRSGFGPSLSLVYDSGSASANGIFGLGWHLQGLDYVSRKTSQALPLYDEGDIFFHSRVGELVPVLRNDGVGLDEDDRAGYCVRKYRPRVESDPMRIECWVRKENPSDIFWKTVASNNTTAIYGRNEGSRIFHRERRMSPSQDKIFTWLVSDIYDSYGNYMAHSYKGEDGLGVSDRDKCTTQRYPKSIKYGNRTPNRNLEKWEEVELWDQDAAMASWMFEVVLDYGEHEEALPTTQQPQDWTLRDDPFSVCTSGFEVRTYRLCSRVLMFHHIPEELEVEDCLVASINFQYETEPKSGTTFLKTCTASGHTLDTREQCYSTLSLPSMQFDYNKPPDLGSLHIENIELNLSGFSSGRASWVDLDGDGVPGILGTLPGGCYYHPNLSQETKTEIGGPTLQNSIPSAMQSEMWHFEDVKARGFLDLVSASPDGRVRGFYGRREEGEWEPFVPFKSYPILDHLQNGWDIYQVDLTGDGLADILQKPPNNNSEWLWNRSLGPNGYGEERYTVGAPKIPSDPATAIFLRDMSGDGLTDIVSVHNGNITYWPNMGHGRFGRQVDMLEPPTLLDLVNFSPLRVRMADITGWGGTDFVYLLPEGGAIVYYNQWGTRWSRKYYLPFIPPLDRFAAADIFSVNGKGTQCLCWTSDVSGSQTTTTLRIIDLMGGDKPGLLTNTCNGMGGRSTIQYRSATSYYLEAKRRGRPWTTRLPFAVECVESVTFNDDVAQTSYNTQYIYHNGYYDYKERQFRGFQMVEEKTGEDFAVGITGAQFKQPQVIKRNWFYLGLEQLDQATLLPNSFQIPGPQYKPVSSATISQDLSVTEKQEACAALAGKPRRQEIYGSGVRSKGHLPYTISEQSYIVVIHQRVQEDKRGIFRVNIREELQTLYEKGEGQPRLKHTLPLKTDDFGNIERLAIISYGNNKSALATVEDRKKQEETAITYTEMLYTNPILEPKDCLRTPLVAKVIQYQVYQGSSLTSAMADGRHSWEKLAANDCKLLTDAIKFPVPTETCDWRENIPAEGYAALHSKNITLYRREDLTAPLPLGKIEPYSITHQVYQLCFTTQLMGTIPISKLCPFENVLESTGYVQLPVSSGGQIDEWWSPSLCHRFEAATLDQANNELLAARSQFFIPHIQIDQFGNIMKKQLDPYKLLFVETLDPMENTTRVVYDYACLQSNLIIDENGNKTQFARDPFGVSVGVAAMGKEKEPVGDSLEEFIINISPSERDQFVKNPSGPIAAKLLGKAGRRMIYDFNFCERSQTPGFQAELVRDTHYRDAYGTTQISVHISYLDGRGRAIQSATFCGDESGREWQFSGLEIQSQNGQPVKQFLSFFKSSHRFCFQSERLDEPASIYLRDPMARPVGIINADQTWSKRQYTPWMEGTWDAGDTILIDDPCKDDDVGIYFQLLERKLYHPTWHSQKIKSDDPADRLAAKMSETYSNTPESVYLDTQGREILSEQRSGLSVRQIRKQYDARGNLSALSGPCNRIVSRTWYDYLDRPLHGTNMDSGVRWALLDCTGAPFISQTNNDWWKRVGYDALRRIKSMELLPQSDQESPVCVVQNRYGDEEGVQDAARKNLRGRLYQCKDQSGVETNVHFDFKGNCIESSIQCAAKYNQLLDWSLGEVELQPKQYITRSSFDAVSHAVNRATDGSQHVHNRFNVAGRLEQVSSATTEDSFNITSYVLDIKYSADGQIISVRYENGSQAGNTYDVQTRRLQRTIITKNNGKTALQDVSFVYDCLGKVVEKTDAAQETTYFRNEVIKPKQQFQYDSFGQLISATGREQVGSAGDCLIPYSPTSGKANTVPGDGKQLIEYLETYVYDISGNILETKHEPASSTMHAGWTRHYTYGEVNNRLISTRVASCTESYKYEGDDGLNGCMTSMGAQSLLWDYNHRLRSFSKQRVKEGRTPETTWYIYNSQGRRVRKVTAGDAKSKDTLYLPLCDIVTSSSGSKPVTQKTTTSVGDLSSPDTPMVMIETSTTDNTSTGQSLLRYQMSENLELDEQSNVISYEEYSPYGSTTYQAPTTEAPRKYRFANYQCDNESELYHCGERYYAPRLARWTSVDSIGTAGGLNLYCYVGNDPVNFQDHHGTVPTWADIVRKNVQPIMPEAIPGPSTASAAPTEADFKPFNAKSNLHLKRYINTYQKHGSDWNVHLWSSVLEFKDPVTTENLAHLAQMGFNEMGTLFENEGLDAGTKPSVMVAMRLQDERTVVLASSTKGSQDKGMQKGSPSEYYYNSTINKDFVNLLNKVTQKKTLTGMHRTGACGELGATLTLIQMSKRHALGGKGLNTMVAYGTVNVEELKRAHSDKFELLKVQNLGANDTGLSSYRQQKHPGFPGGKVPQR